MRQTILKKKKLNFRQDRFFGSLNATVCDQIHQQFHTPLTSQFVLRNLINYYNVVLYYKYSYRDLLYYNI